MGKLNPGQRGKVNNVFSDLAPDQLIGGPDLDHFFGGALHEQVQVLKIGNIGETKSAIIPVNGCRAIDHIIEVQLIALYPVFKGLCLVYCFQNDIEVKEKERIVLRFSQFIGLRDIQIHRNSIIGLFIIFEEHIDLFPAPVVYVYFLAHRFKVTIGANLRKVWESPRFHHEVMHCFDDKHKIGGARGPVLWPGIYLPGKSDARN
jgi:hypothetical protein